MTDYTGPVVPTLADDDVAVIDRVSAGNRRASEALARKRELRVFRVAQASIGNFEYV